MERVAIASDHAGFDLKSALKKDLTALGFEILDLGTDSRESVDYPDFAAAMARVLAEGEATRGVLICGTGIGISIAANRHRELRAALCHDAETARLSREHNDANVLVLGGRTTPEAVARDCVRVFFTTEFVGGRHVRRVAKLA